MVYQGRDYDLGKPFRRITVEQSIIDNNPGIDPLSLRDVTYLRSFCEKLGIPVNQHAGAGGFADQGGDASKPHRSRLLRGERKRRQNSIPETGAP